MLGVARLTVLDRRPRVAFWRSVSPRWALKRAISAIMARLHRGDGGVPRPHLLLIFALAARILFILLPPMGRILVD